MSFTCHRCGGGLLPEDGARRLLEDELGHPRAQLVELARLVAGAALRCPHCQSNTSPLQLRGAHVDLCFGCGALWLDQRDLEVLSAGRYSFPARAIARQVNALAPSRSVVRVDTRPPLQRTLRNAAGATALFGALWSLLPFPSGMSSGTWVVLAIATVLLSRRRGTDVRVRARRVVPWVGFWGPSSRDEGDALPAGAFVLVRSGGSRWLRHLMHVELADPEGRCVTPLAPRMMRLGPATVHAKALGEQLGVPVRVDDDREAPEPDAPALPAAFTSRAGYRLQPLEVAGARQRRVRIVDDAGTTFAEALTDVALVLAPVTLRQALAEQWSLQDGAQGLTVRLLPSARYGSHTTLLLHPDGSALGHVRVKRSFLADHVEWWSVGRRRGAFVWLRHGAHAATLRDQRGVACGTVTRAARTPSQMAPVTVHLAPDALPGVARVGVLAVALHLCLLGAVLEE